MKYPLKKLPSLILGAALLLAASSEAFSQATVTILNLDMTGVGFNDTTPATPVGGNSGTTVGQQRLNAVQFAANIWGATLASGPTIVIRATWQDMSSSCTATSGTLASAGNSGNIWRDFTGSVPGFWYGNALANAISNTDRNGATHEINTQFNLSLGTPNCLAGSQWYYGLDTNQGAGGINLVSVTLHELGHGLGFQTFTNRTTGQQAGDDTNGRFPSIYDRYLFDNAANKTWPLMTDAERVASAIKYQNLVWSGPQVNADVPRGVLSVVPSLRVNSPPEVAAKYQIGTANFGPLLTASGITAPVVQTIPNDGCSAISNSVTGRIALIDRGTCTFITKTRNAQNAGAIGVIIVDNVSNPTPPGLGGGPDNTITISAVSITMADGSAIKAQLGTGVSATLFSDLRPFLYTPKTLAPGSSVSHWDTSLTPNQLMEPNIAGDLSHSVRTPLDLTLSLFKDIGWPINPNPAPIVHVEQGTTKAAAVDSVTFIRGPFTVTTAHNFSADGRRRLIIFTTPELPPNPTISVTANGIPLTVESAGIWNALAGTSYIVVVLPNLTASPPDYAISVRVNGVNSTNAPTIQIIP